MKSSVGGLFNQVHDLGHHCPNAIKDFVQWSVSVHEGWGGDDTTHVISVELLGQVKVHSRSDQRYMRITLYQS